jgi:hypothetical protein
MMKANRFSVLVVALSMLGVSGAAMAQDQNGNRRQRGQDQQGQQGRQRGGDPAQFREQMMNRYKERLGATDEEWKVLQPKIEKVMASQRDGRGGGSPGGRGGRDRGGDQQNAQRTDREQSAVSKAAAELRAAIEDKSTSADDITKKLAAYREAREKSRADRAAAQKELREVLSARQEAVLVSSGLLD